MVSVLFSFPYPGHFAYCKVKEDILTYFSKRHRLYSQKEFMSGCY